MFPLIHIPLSGKQVLDILLLVFLGTMFVIVTASQFGQGE